MSKKTKLSLSSYRTLDRNNEYFKFIESCSTKYGPDPFPEGRVRHVHHIIPVYVFRNATDPEDLIFKESPENRIYLSLEDHLEAHRLLYEIYGNIEDYGATQVLAGQMSEAARAWKQAGAYASHKVQRDAGRHFWNPDFQAEMGRRSLAKPDAKLVRSIGGRKGGITTKRGVAIQPHHRYTFSYEGNEVVSVLNCQTGQEVLEILQQIVPTTIQRVTPLLNGTRSSSHGWTCKRLLDGPKVTGRYLDKLREQLYSDRD